MTIKKIQQALKKLGFDPGPVDGVMGGKTRSAIRAFQISKGLAADGLVGPATSTALFGSAPKVRKDELPVQLPWLIEATRLISTREIEGPEHNEIILNWAQDLNVGYSSDEVPWCGLFAAHCVSSQIDGAGLPTNPLGARQWLKFGRKVTPQLGSVLVFWRGKRDGWKGHVGFYWAEDENNYHVLGGNQSNAVNIKALSKKRLLDARWPEHIAETSITRLASADGVLQSTTEQ